ncbi:MAG: gfo/Idh/MocA family oxidoreductase, partial [Thermoprotei archaeon]
MRVGVIGCGSIGKVHISNLKKLPGVDVVAACDIDEGELKVVKEKFGVESLYTDYHDLVSRSDLDAVVVATPNYLHYPMTVDALKEGKHVLCEKPPALTAREVREMYEASRKYGRALLIGLTMRFRPDSRALKSYVENVGIGEPYYARAGVLRRSGIPGYGSWFTRRSEAGAGPLYDIGVHALDLAFWLMGDFRAREV